MARWHYLKNKMLRIPDEFPDEYMAHDCVECGITFFIEQRFANIKFDNDGHFYCPNGHALTWKHKKEEQRKKKEQQDEKDREIERLECEKELYRGLATINVFKDDP